MNRFGWFVLNITLVAVLCSVGILMGESDPSAHWREVKKEIVESAIPAQKQPEAQQDVETVAATEINRFPIDSRTANVLWQRTLFNPDRTEDIEIKQETEAAKKEATPDYQFEIRGIMMVRDQWVVSLAVTQKSAPRPAVERTIRGRRVSVGRPATAKPATPDKAKKTTKIYHVGDAVDETGYTVESISMEAVTLKRGEEELVLSVDLNDEMSQKRRDEAARAEAAKAPPTKAIEAKEGTTVPTVGAGKNTPPPPPPAPGMAVTVPPSVGTATSADKGTLEERLKRIRERRAELLKKNQTKPSTSTK